MEKFVYRFRSPEALLSGFNELEKQEIYFASPEEQNDPMEGFRDIFWRGDKVIWMNLYRHYLRCLFRATSIWLLMGEEEEIGWDDVPIANPSFADDDVAPIVGIAKDIEETFFSSTGASAFFDAISNRATPVRRDELRAHLQVLHGLALHIIIGKLADAGLAARINLSQEQKEQVESSFVAVKKLVDAAEKFLQSSEQPEAKIVSMYTAWMHTQDQLKIIRSSSSDGALIKNNKIFIISRFPEEYVSQVESILHPKIYTASFVDDCRDAALWAYYGKNHAGVCLQFRPSFHRERSCLELECITGFDSNGDIRDYRPHQYLDVEYSDSWVSVDFFRSIGGLPAPTINKNWLFSPTGERSICADSYLNDQNLWRKQYWEIFDRCGRTKLSDWKHEKEMRLRLHSNLSDLTDASSRTLKYKFAALAGVVFGMKTPVDQKIEILKIIDSKCKAEGRTDFKFYQAYYSPASNGIELAELSLLGQMR